MAKAGVHDLRGHLGRRFDVLEQIVEARFGAESRTRCSPAGLSAAETTMLVSMTSRSGIMHVSVFGHARL